MARKKARPQKAPKAPKRKAEPVAAEPVLEEVDSGGMGIDEGIVITTTLILIGAIFLIYSALQMYAP